MADGSGNSEVIDIEQAPLIAPMSLKPVRKQSDFSEEQSSSIGKNKINARSSTGTDTTHSIFLWPFIYIYMVLDWLFRCIRKSTRSIEKFITARRHRKVAATSSEHSRHFEQLCQNPQNSSQSALMDLDEIQVTAESAETLQSHPRVLSSNQMKDLVKHAIPTHLHWKKWERLFSSSRDGDSFQSMLHKTKGHRYTLIVIKTVDGEIFGGFVATPWTDAKRDTFFGTGQAFLFSFVDRDGTEKDVNIYKWTGANMYIQLCDGSHSRLAMGGGGTFGSFGLVVEENFCYGSSGR